MQHVRILEDIRENWVLYLGGLAPASLLFYAALPNSDPTSWNLAKFLLMMLGIWSVTYSFICVKRRKFYKILKVLPSIGIMAMLPLEGYGIVQAYERWHWQAVEVYSGLFILFAVWKITRLDPYGNNFED